MTINFKKKKPIVSKIIIAALLYILGMVVLFATTIILDLSCHKIWIVEVGSYVALVVYAFLMVVILSKGKIALYGFQWPKRIKWLPVILCGVGMGSLSSTIAFFLHFDSGSFLKELSFLRMVIVTGVCASVAEESLARGLIQGYLYPLQMHKICLAGIRVSLPVFVAALLFGFMHFTVILTGASGFFVAAIIIFTFVAGLVAGYYRETTNSIVPAIVLHFLINVSGCGIANLFELFR